MANGRDWTESSELPLPKKKESWTRFIRPVWWSFIIVVGAWAFFRASDDVGRQEAAARPDAAAVARDTGRE